ncbi:MAG: hypothetical protein EZS28_036698, partial [Streblomastix strix]
MGMRALQTLLSLSTATARLERKESVSVSHAIFAAIIFEECSIAKGSARGGPQGCFPSIHSKDQSKWRAALKEYASFLCRFAMQHAQSIIQDGEIWGNGDINGQNAFSQFGLSNEGEQYNDEDDAYIEEDDEYGNRQGIIGISNGRNNNEKDIWKQIIGNGIVVRNEEKRDNDIKEEEGVKKGVIDIQRADTLTRVEALFEDYKTPFANKK